MLFGVILVFIQTFIQIRLTFRNINDLRFNEPQEIQEMRHEIAVWQRAAASLSSYSKDEDIVRETLAKKVNRLKKILKKKITSTDVPVENYKQTLEDMQAKVIFFIIYSKNYFNLNIFPVSNQEQAIVDQIEHSFDFCCWILLPSFRPRFATPLSWMDCSSWSYLASHPSRQRRHGVCAGEGRVVNIVVLCCLIHTHGVFV